MLVRDAGEGDLAGILAIYNEVVATTVAIYSDDLSTLVERRDWWHLRCAQNYPVLVAEDETGIIGFASFSDFRPQPGYRLTVEHSVHVRADRRGRGIGGALLAALFPRAIALGKHVMVGAIDAANVASLRLHERLDFNPVAYMPEVARKFDRWLDLVLVQRLL